MGKQKRTLSLLLDVWYRPEDGHIHLKISGQEERMSTVSDRPELKRGHPHLFQHLKEELQAVGMWDRE